jgi:hypothetical protein
MIPASESLDVTAGVFGLEQVFGVGDLVVSVDSAVADASRGASPFVAVCNSSLLELITEIDDSPCSHTNELANRRIERRVRDLVRDAVRALPARRIASRDGRTAAASPT